MTDGILRSVTHFSSVTRAPSPAAPPPTTLLDLFPDAAVAYSFRKLKDAYAGSAVRIRRSSDSTEADIGFSGDDFDTAAAAAHIGGGSGFIVTWYDQSGNGRNITQGTAGAQPPYSAAGLFSLPTATFDNGASNALTSANTTMFNGQGTITLMCVCAENGAPASNRLFDWNSGEVGIWAAFSDNRIYWDYDGGPDRVDAAQPGDWLTQGHILEAYRDSSDLQALVVDGASLASGTRTGDPSATNTSFTLGRGSVSFNGAISEFIIWFPDVGATDRAGVRNNMNSYYSVF